MKGKVIRFIDNLDRNKTGRVLFGTGMIGFMVSGCCLDSRAWFTAVLGVALSVGVCVLGYRMTDWSRSVKWESKRIREKKAENRRKTYENWVGNTSITK